MCPPKVVTTSSSHVRHRSGGRTVLKATQIVLIDASATPNQIK